MKGSRSPRVPLSDPRGLAWALERARLIRVGLALALAAAGAAAVVSALGLRERSLGLLPEQSSNVMVLDVSASVRPDVYWQIDRIIQEAVRSGDQYGLVLFSSGAYEALAPGTPVRELGRYGRFFRPLSTPEEEDVPEGLAPTTSELVPEYPGNPWGGVLTGGTRISTGLGLARDILVRDGVRDGGVVLVSDLDDDGADIPILADVLTQYADERRQLRVVALNAQPQHRRFFERILGSRTAVRDAPTPPENPTTAPAVPESESFPVWLVVSGIALLALLGLNELLCGRLTWRPSAEAAR